MLTCAAGLLQDGKQFGDEYLAELDYIENVESAGKTCACVTALHSLLVIQHCKNIDKKACYVLNG